MAALGFSDTVALLAFLVSLGAVAVGYYFGRRQTLTARQANQIPALVDLFREHRSEHLAQARAFVCGDKWPQAEQLAGGLEALPHDRRQPVRDLMWFYDNLGALVSHGIVDLEPIAGYLGGSVRLCWDRLAPLIEAERSRREAFPDPSRWQEYFENLDRLVKDYGPWRARRHSEHWRI